jgi:CheY-like chemotaxis protein
MILSAPHDANEGRAPRASAASAGSGAFGLEGRRVLLVEDETMVAMMIEDLLADLGCELIGTASRVAEALRLVETLVLDIAVLDVNVGGETVFPVADALAARNVPFVFSTGYGVAGIEAGHLQRPVLQKPYGRDRLAAALVKALRPA